MRIIGLPFSADEKIAALAEARACIGIPWKHRGRQGLPWGSQVGLDCLGFIGRAIHAAGRTWEDRTYGRDPDGTLLAGLDAHLGERTTGFVPCSVIAMRWRGQPRHVALLTEANTLIHSYNGGPMRVVEHVFDDRWRAFAYAGWAL